MNFCKLLIFIDGLTRGKAVFHRGFTHSSENFGTAHVESLKVSYPMGWNSPPSAKLCRSMESEGAKKGKASPRQTEWMRIGAFDAVFEEAPKNNMNDPSRILNPGRSELQHRIGILGDSTSRKSVATSRSMPQPFALNGKSPRHQDDPTTSRFQGYDPLLALCFDFDQTLSQDHIHKLRRSSTRGKQAYLLQISTSTKSELFPGVDYIEAFGGRERILRLGTFLEDLRSAGAAIHIISHGFKNEILKVMPSDDIPASSMGNYHR
jgi:hypothetical protein